MDIGHHSIGIGQENNPSTVLIARSINGTRARIESPKRSVLNLNHGGGYSFENNNKQFSINGTDKSKPYFYVKSQSQIGVFTTKVSDEINSLVIDGDMGLMNTSEIFVQNALKKTWVRLKKVAIGFNFSCRRQRTWWSWILMKGMLCLL